MNPDLKVTKILVLSNNSALGDTICTLPAVNHLKKGGALAGICCSEQFAPIYRLFFPDDVTVFDVKTQKIEATGCLGRWTYVEFITTIQTHLVDYSSMVLSDTILKDRSYLKAPKLKQDFVDEPFVLIGTNHTSDMKKFRGDCVIDVSKAVLDMGLRPVWVGKNYVCSMGLNHEVYIDGDFLESPPDGVLDLRNKTDVLELLALCQDAECVLGMDSGVIHLAGLTDTPIVCGYSHKDPWYLMPIRDNQLGKNVYSVTPPESSCRFCMTCQVMPAQNFANCARGDLQCIDNITAEMFISQLERALNENGSHFDPASFGLWEGQKERRHRSESPREACRA